MGGMMPISFSSAISACEKDGQWDHIVLLLCQCCSECMTPDVISFSSAITACEKGARRVAVGASNAASQPAEHRGHGARCDQFQLGHRSIQAERAMGVGRVVVQQFDEE